ncbi:MAG: DEAD/DEAH box helicase family protein [Pseudanabaena sp. Salubria-1]|nr:DEAD/DEAH box helicase family protein [Pseudanabaena sp. Salubria-1]
MAEAFYNFRKIEIRDYQQEGIDKIYGVWNSGVTKVMFQMPTGTGKTVVFNQIVKQELEKKSTVLIVAHREELIRQNVERLWEYFRIEAGIIMGNHRINPSRPVQVASIKTLDERDLSWLNPSLIIIDEAHHVPAQSYKRLLNKYSESRILGVTATPIRLNGEGFVDLFDKLITSKPIKEFIKDGHLADIQFFGRKQIWSKLDLRNISTNNTGDYDSTQLSRMMRQDFVMADLVKSYVKDGEGKKMIVFAVDIDHSKDIVKRYEEAGFRAAHLDGTTKKSERKEIINKFKAGEIQILSNFDIVSEGFDVPDCAVVQLARPTKSLVVYLQQVGRCMRKLEGKDYCIVLDNVGLYQEFGSPKDDRPWTLKATKNNPTITNPSQRNFEEFTRNNPEEVDEDLVVLEDVDMPTESKTISKSFPEIDDELKLRIEISNCRLEEEKQSKEKELQNLILSQEERLQKILPTFQSLVEDFCNNDTHWKNEDDKKIFTLRLKISYDFSKNRVKVDLDDREKKVNQYLEVTDVDDELDLRAEILRLKQAIKEKKRDIKALEQSNNIDDFAIDINELRSEISELELNQENKSKELRNTIFDQENRLQKLVENFRGLVYDFFNKNTQWESEDNKKNFVWRLQVSYDFLGNTIKFNLDKRFKKIISYLEVIINEISCFSSYKGIKNNADYSSYYGDDGLDGYDYWTTVVIHIIHTVIEVEYENAGILPDELVEIYNKCFALVLGKHFNFDITYFSS